MTIEEAMKISDALTSEIIGLVKDRYPCLILERLTFILPEPGAKISIDFSTSGGPSILLTADGIEKMPGDFK